MLLDSLLKLVETLRERIDEHGDALRQSEAMTRYALIDPMLRELGWNTDDPAQVVPEYRVANNQMADYVLRANDAPTIVVESKKLDEPLQGGKALDQGILYSAHTRSGYFLLTDGRRWELYEGRSTDLVESFDLLDQSPAEVCLKALALWRPSVESGHVATGNSPVTVKDDAPSATKAITTVQPPRAPHQHEWQSLSELNPQLGSQHPLEVMFPDGSATPVNAWSSLLVEVVRWLVEGGYLKVDDCPIQLPGSKMRYIVNDSPVHPSGKEFFSPERVGQLYVEKHASANGIVRVTKFSAQTVGEAPAQFKVRFPSPPPQTLA